MESKKQIIFIHGGMTFKNKKDYFSYLRNKEISLDKKSKWSKEYLDKELGKKFQIIRPGMPLAQYANYKDWKIWFERYIPYLKNNVILIGVSLGGIFLAKYLSENNFPKKILATILVCPPFDDTLPEEDLAGGFKLKSDLSLIEKNSKNLILMFSENDNVVPIEHAEKYRNKLKNAKIIIYKNKNGHFKIAKFPEIIKIIKLLSAGKY
ncbi:MAG TPA: alpha/beta hydrolase [bacterium]|nr:alpha/beta hydrolase [bacterium]